jgi:Mn-dependent DtxR family transcriptional regulator
MKRKAAELKVKDIQAKASTENFTKEKLRELAKKHGVILALTPELKDQVRDLQRKYNIPSSKIITEQIMENDVLKKFSKIDHEKLGMLAYQRVLMQKEEIGVGLMPISEVYDLVNTGILKEVLDLKDLLKALKILKKDRVIEELQELKGSSVMVRFFPVQYTNDQVKIIGIAKEKGYVSIEDICIALTWSQDRALQTLKSLEDSGIAKFRESLLKGKQWYFPSI